MSLFFFFFFFLLSSYLLTVLAAPVSAMERSSSCFIAISVKMMDEVREAEVREKERERGEEQEGGSKEGKQMRSSIDSSCFIVNLDWISNRGAVHSLSIFLVVLDSVLIFSSFVCRAQFR